MFGPTGKVYDVGDILRQDCQFLEEPIVGEEGKVSEVRGTLRSVTIVFRHGDRSTLYGDFDLPSMDCGAFRDLDRRAFLDYEALISSQIFNSFITVDNSFSQFSYMPHRTRCFRGRLTAEGALQLLKVGNFLRERYLENDFLTATDTRWDIAVYSSLFLRTFQSAVAFVSTFFYPLHDIFGNVNINVSYNQQFCVNAACVCNNLRKMEKLYEKIRTEYFEILVGNETAKNYYKLVNVLQIENLKDPLHFLDVIRGRYTCRRLPLPCRNDVCVKYADVEKIAAVTSMRDFSMFNSTVDSKPSLFRKLMIAQSFAIFQSIKDTIKQLRQSPRIKSIRVYSGHDITLRPLLFALGLNHREPPYYSARFVLEVYVLDELPESKSPLHFRILYNGKDRTKDLSFCESKYHNNLCPVDHLINFIESHLLQLANVDSLNELCDSYM